MILSVYIFATVGNITKYEALKSLPPWLYIPIMNVPWVMHYHITRFTHNTVTVDALTTVL